MANGETVDRILRAATILFAERGFAETSLRTITGMADANLAAVNYYFGSKKSLIQAVFRHFLTPFCHELETRLDHMERQLSPSDVPSADTLLRILVTSFTESVASIHENPHRFMQLLGLAYTQSQEHLRQHLAENYAATYQRFVCWLQKCHPELDPVVFQWRMNFALGACIFTLGSFESIKAILQDQYNSGTDMDSALTYLVDALAAMLESPQSR